jgi:hypothetical protein
MVKVTVKYKLSHTAEEYKASSQSLNSTTFFAGGVDLELLLGIGSVLGPGLGYGVH